MKATPGELEELKIGYAYRQERAHRELGHMLCSILNTQRKRPMELDRWIGKPVITREFLELERAEMKRRQPKEKKETLMTPGKAGWERELDNMSPVMRNHVMRQHYKKQREQADGN